MNPSNPTTTGPEPAAAPSNFIRDIIIEDLKTNKYRRPRAHALSAGAERLPAHRPRQVDLPEFRTRRGIRRQDQPALRRHQSREGRAGVRRFHPWRTSAGSGFDWEDRLFYASDYFGQLYEWADPADPGGQGVRLRPDAPRRSGSTAARSPSPARRARTATAPWRRTSTCSRA